MTSTDLSLHSARSFEPPYDDEPGSSAAMTDGSLALALPLASRPVAAPTLRLVDGGARTGCKDLPPARLFGARLVQVLSEATAGERPLTHLAPHLAGHVYARLERGFAATVRGTGTVGPGNKASVRSVRVCEPRDGVAEVAAVVRRGGRVAAIALRLEGIDGRWQCTALQIG